MTTLVMDSPVGKLAVESGPRDEVCRIDFIDGAVSVSPAKSLAASRAVTQLEEFFAGERQCFDLDYRLAGTEFQQQVWRQIAAIPYGRTITYGDIARAIGKPAASRAVGGACGRNPVAIVVPCHRVIGSGDKLTGFGGGLQRKEWLLGFEQRLLAGDS